MNFVLRALRLPPYEPLSDASFINLSMKTLFLVALATSKRVSELQAVSVKVARIANDLSLSYVPSFVAKTESIDNPIPRSFLLKNLKDFVGDMEEEKLLCPVRALKYYLAATNDLAPRSDHLFVSPRLRKRAISKNAISFYLRKLIVDTGALGADEGPTPRAHSIRGVSASLAFHRNWAVKEVLKAATWRSNTVFASYYLKDVAYVWDGFSSLGAFVAAGQILNPSIN